MGQSPGLGRRHLIGRADWRVVRISELPYRRQYNRHFVRDHTNLDTIPVHIPGSILTKKAFSEWCHTLLSVPCYQTTCNLIVHLAGCLLGVLAY